MAQQNEKAREIQQLIQSYDREGVKKYIRENQPKEVISRLKNVSQEILPDYKN